MDKEDFYLRCAEITGVEHEMTIRSPHVRRNRWNNRQPGSGRFPGVGIIRYFGSVIHMALISPETCTRTFASPEEALAYLSKLYGIEQ